MRIDPERASTGKRCSEFGPGTMPQPTVLLMLGAYWGDTFINIRDARLQDTDGLAYSYSWTDGWLRV